MVTVLERGREILGGGYVSPNPNRKTLVDLGESRKEWLRRVAGFLNKGSVTEVLKALVDQASLEDPESFATKVEKYRLKMRIEELDEEERRIAEEKQKLVESLQPSHVHHDGDGARK